MRIKKFQTSSGLEVLVGQDDESNDALTLSVGHPNDLWFHVSGAPGSHVVLRCGDVKEKLDKASIQEAAALAAWFSKMRQGGKVAVHYCPVKNVRKPRGAKAGSVRIRKAEKMVVRPALLKEIPSES